MATTKACSAAHTQRYGSPYPKHAVPLELFMKNPNNPNSPILNSCWHCREPNRLRSLKVRADAKEKTKQALAAIKNGESEFGYCSEQMHSGAVGSQYPKDKVPKHMFWKNPNDPKSESYLQCSDCRTYKANVLNGWKHGKRDESELKGLFRCYHCHREISADKRALNLDGTYSIHCLDCKEMQHIRNVRRSEYLRTIQLEFMAKQECSCYMCKCLFFNPAPQTLVPIRVATYEENGQRYFNVNGVKYSVKTMFHGLSKFFETSVLHFDHLTESEQRQRGMLLPHEVFVPKEIDVNDAMSESAKRLEARKCQLICVECHVKITIYRIYPDGSNAHAYKSPIHLEKLNYVNNLKLSGCVSCGYKTATLFRFLDMDHLNPATKIDNVGSMIQDSNFSLNDIITECQKCRVLCKFCHIIHTNGELKLKSNK